MGGSRFTLNKAGIRALLTSDAMGAAMMKHAETIAATARSIAPVGAEAHDSHPGEYRDSITTRRADREDRAAAEVVATAPYARWVEYGNGQGGSAHHTISRGAGIADVG